MSKYNSNISSVYSMVSDLSTENLKPVYFLFGEDHFTLNNAIKTIEKYASPLITSDFDNETISVDKKANLSDILDLAYTFPFGSQKKLLIVKNFENFSNKKLLTDYLNNPSESTVLILANYGSISAIKSEPYNLLNSKQYLFEARELKGAELQNWVKKRCSQLEFSIAADELKMLIEIVGEDKSLLEMQIQKFKSFLGENKEITSNEIKKLSSATKEYSIFDLLNSIGKGNTKDSLKVMSNLLNHSKDLVFIINMLTKYFSIISQSIELQSRNLSDQEAAKILGVSKYYYINCKNAVYFKDAHKLSKAFKTLYNIDLTLKTTMSDQKTLSIMLLSEIFSGNKDNF
jgi:DNA polymerase-3 subunit delta